MIDEEYFYSLCHRDLKKEWKEFKIDKKKSLNSFRKKRKCNRCGKEFSSKSSGNRRCPLCEHNITRAKINDRHLDYIVYLDEIPKKYKEK